MAAHLECGALSPLFAGAERLEGGWDSGSEPSGERVGASSAASKSGEGSDRSRLRTPSRRSACHPLRRRRTRPRYSDASAAPQLRPTSCLRAAGRAAVLGFRRIVKAARAEDLFQNRSQVAVSVRYQDDDDPIFVRTVDDDVFVHAEASQPWSDAFPCSSRQGKLGIMGALFFDPADNVKPSLPTLRLLDDLPSNLQHALFRSVRPIHACHHLRQPDSSYSSHSCRRTAAKSGSRISPRPAIATDSSTSLRSRS